MSRDYTPRELDLTQQKYNIPELTQNLLKINDDGSLISPYSDELKVLVVKYPRLGRFGLDLLNLCLLNSVYENEQGKALLQKIEDYFENKPMSIDDFILNVKKWYDGKFCSGFYMDNNNIEFMEYLKKQIS